MISQGNTSLAIGEVLSSVSESKILAYYLNITEVPTVIQSPLRKDDNPSFGIYSPDGTRIRYKDFATGETGGIIDLLQQLWGYTFIQVLDKIVKDSISDLHCPIKVNKTIEKTNTTIYSRNTNLEVKVRKWKDYDIQYWNQFGISKELLEKANVYPISHYFITKDGTRMVFGADRYAYVYAEFKEGKTTLKVYQPFNKSSFKWISKHDRSVLGLWTLLPEKGDIVCICSSVKDALCLYANTNIPSICLQGEAYKISESAQKVLRSRFTNVCIMLDSDTPGKLDAERLTEQTGFINVPLPESTDYKDIAELFTFLQDKEQFKTIILNQFKQFLQLC